MKRTTQPASLPLEALPDEEDTKRRVMLEADQAAAFRRKVADLGETLDELPEARQLMLFELEAV